MERSRRMKKTFEIKLPFKDNILTFKFGKTLMVEIDDERLSSNAKHMKLIREFLNSMFEDSILYLTYVDNHFLLLEIYNKLYHSLTDKRNIKTPQEMEQIFGPVSEKYLLDDRLVLGGVADSDVDAAAAAGAADQNLGNVDMESEDTFNTDTLPDITDTLPDITDLVQDEDKDVNLREVMDGGYKKTKRKRKPKKTKKKSKVKKTRAKKMSKRSRKGKKKSKKR